MRALAQRAARLDVADQGLCFGRLDTLSGERLYVGRIGIFDDDNDHEALLLDWRAPPASRASTSPPAPTPPRACGDAASSTPSAGGWSTSPTRSSAVPTPDAGGDDSPFSSDAALLAAVNAPRGEGMRDIVATIQAEQDEIIRLEHPGVLVIEGGPGTGKTVVALHRVAYLLYTQRRRIERHGVLVVGPNQAFMNHIGRVLPSLGESEVVFSTVGDLVPGMHVTAEDIPEVARIKGSRAMLAVLRAAIEDRQRTPEQPLEIPLGDVTMQIAADTAQWAIDEARASGLPHNAARAVFRDIVTYVLTERGGVARIGRGWLTRDNKDAWAKVRADLLADLEDNERFIAALDQLWPVLEPQELLAELYTSPERLRAAGADAALLREVGDAWTTSDVPLLDELVDLLGRDKAADDAAAQALKEETHYARGVFGEYGRPRGSDGRRGSSTRAGLDRRRGPRRTLPRK